MSARRPVFFRPADGWVGDVIPFQADGTFWLFYLHEQRAEPKPGTSWNLFTTTDLVNFDDQGVALAHGNYDDPDFNAYTGSVVRDESGVHHLFYTGQNPSLRGPDNQPVQIVMHATSDDGMTTWTKHPERRFGATPGYETADWRDPFVFYDERTSQWRMLLAARHTTGPQRRRGVIAQCVSDDLVTWRPAEPFWDPRRYITHECPEVFQWGDWWYLVFSEFSESFCTRYRMAASPDGPWTAPAQDTIDGRAFYASKSAERYGRRFFFGWIASKEDERDDGAWQWAGTLSVLEAHQNPDGTLGFGLPHELVDSFTETVPTSIGPATLRAPDGYTAVVSEDEAPSQFYAKAVLRIEPGTTECGLLLRASADGDESYIVRLEPQRGRLVFDRWPRRSTGEGQWQISGDVPFEIELERPCELAPGTHSVEVVVDGDLCVVVLDRQVSLSARIYDRPAGRIGVFAGVGCAVIEQFEVRQRTPISKEMSTR